LKPIKKIDLKIGSKGYSDIKNAVFFEVQDNEGYLYQYNKKGVSYICEDK
jgi:predicted DNA-binding antitoxin AbrB/MazE fold protein